MKHQNLLRLLSSLLVALPLAALAGEFGTAAEAKAMLDKAVAALKANKADALAKFQKGEGGFKDRDLYPFCGGPDGNFTAHPSLTGKSLKDLKDKAGKALGAEMYKVAEEGKTAEVSYMWPRPGQTDPVQKVSFVTKVGDQVCAVGYYK
jgi:signal transduction histidine kinase